MDTRTPFYRSPDPVALGVEYNDDCSAFAVGTQDGFRLFDTATGKLTYDRDLDGSITFASVISKSRCVALIGGGPYPKYPPNKFVLWDDQMKDGLFKIEYNSTPIRACLTPTRFVVVFERGIVLYRLEPDSHDNNSNSRIGVYETAANPYGLCCLGNHKLAFPGRTKGQVHVVDLATRNISILPAHNSALRALALSKDESMLATASDAGTLIRIWSTKEEAKIFEVRRGLDHATIFSIAFSPSNTYMAVTSDKSTLHIFDLPRQECDIPRETEPSTLTKSKSRSPRTSSSSSSKPVTVPSSRKGAASTTTSGGSPSSRNYGISPPGGKYKLGTSPTDATSIIAPSDITAPSRASPSRGGDIAWNDLLRTQPQSSLSPSSGNNRRPSHSSNHSTTSSSIELISDADLVGYRPVQKYGKFAAMPFAPRILSDTYSAMSCAFEMGDEPAPSASGSRSSQSQSQLQSAAASLYTDSPASSIHTTRTSLTSATATTASALGSAKPKSYWPGNKPPKGKIAWLDEQTLVIVGAGRDARWEKFVIGVDGAGQRAVGRMGWKWFLEGDGLD